MKCFNCNHINERGSKFCSNCGKDFKAKKSEHNNNPNYPNLDAVKMHGDKYKEKSNNPATVIIVYLLALIVLFFIVGGDLASFFVISLVMLVFAVMGICATRVVTEEFYYTIPTSRDVNGNHRCIFCGNKGIYKSTIYRTSTTVNACSKCSKELFRN